MRILAIFPVFLALLSFRTIQFLSSGYFSQDCAKKRTLAGARLHSSLRGDWTSRRSAFNCRLDLALKKMSNAADYVGAARKLENVVHDNLTDSLQVRKLFSPFTQEILTTHLTIVLLVYYRSLLSHSVSLS